MSEPSTEAGKALAAWSESDMDGLHEYGVERVVDAILAIEAEAATAPKESAVMSRELLLRAVDLRAVAWNTLCAVPVRGLGDWDRFWRKLHELREAVNRPEHEDIRIAYASTFPNGPTQRETRRRILDEHWRIVDPESGGTE